MTEIEPCWDGNSAPAPATRLSIPRRVCPGVSANGNKGCFTLTATHTWCVWTSTSPFPPLSISPIFPFPPLSLFLSVLHIYTHTHMCYNYSHKTLTQPRAVEAETKGIRTKALVDFSWEVKVHVLTLSLCWTETRLDGLGPTRRLEGQQPVAKWE